MQTVQGGGQGGEHFGNLWVAVAADVPGARSQWCAVDHRLTKPVHSITSASASGTVAQQLIDDRRGSSGRLHQSDAVTRVEQVLVL